jgi:hypothetical protein
MKPVAEHGARPGVRRLRRLSERAFREAMSVMTLALG